MSKTKNNPNLIPTMPAQAIHSSKKTDEWAKQTMEAIESMSSAFKINGRTSSEHKQVNYNLLNNIFDPSDFKYVYDQQSIGLNYDKLPAKIRNINLISDKIASLKGEELETPFEWTAIGIGGEILNTIEEKKNELLNNTVLKMVRQELGLEPTVDEQGNQIPPEDPQRVVDNFRTSYRDKREIQANRLLEKLWEKLGLKEKFNLGWEHALISSEEFYYIGIIGGSPNVRVVNPLNFDYDKSPELIDVADADWAREERWLSVGQVIDELGEYLTEKEVKDLESGRLGNPSGESYFFNEFAYKPVDFKINLVNSSKSGNSSGSYYRVADFAWKSRKKIGFVRQITEDGQLEEVIVDDTFKLSAEQINNGVTIEWLWINTVYKGTKVADSIFVNVEELPFQSRSIENPSECKLPYVGRVYNNVNAQAASFVDLLKPHQYLYNIIWYRLEDELAKAKGKAVIMDLAQLPKSEGMDITEWIHYLNNAGIMFINSFEEGTGENAGKTSAFNQFTEIDRAASAVIGQYISIIAKIEQLVDRISGISLQRQGNTTPSESATGVEQAVRNSSTITAPYFYKHDTVKKDVLTQLVGVCRVADSVGKKGRYFVDETYSEMVEIDGTEFADSDYGVFITNGAQHKKKLETINQGATMALQASSMQIKEFVSLINSNSFAEKRSVLEKGEAQSQERLMAVEKQKEEIVLKAEQERTKREMEKQSHVSAIAQLESDTKIAVAQINALGFAEDKDVNKDLIPDVLQVEKVNLERRKASLDERKQTNQEAIDRKKLELENKKIDTQLKIAKENKNKYDKK